MPTPIKRLKITDRQNMAVQRMLIDVDVRLFLLRLSKRYKHKPIKWAEEYRFSIPAQARELLRRLQNGPEMDKNNIPLTTCRSYGICTSNQDCPGRVDIY